MLTDIVGIPIFEDKNTPEGTYICLDKNNLPIRTDNKEEITKIIVNNIETFKLSIKYNKKDLYMTQIDKQGLSEEQQRFREVMCEPQVYDDIILWRKDLNVGSTELILKIEEYWIKRLSQVIVEKHFLQALKAQRLAFIKMIDEFSESDHSENEAEKNISRGVKLLKSYLLRELKEK
jgi:hypothetical protein